MAEHAELPDMENPLNNPRHLRFWLITLGATLLLVWLLSSILLPFIAAMAVAYFLDPAADKLEDWGCSRTLATSIIVALFFLIVILLAVLILPILQQQIVDFVTNVPDYLKSLQNFALSLLERVQGKMSDQDIEKLRGAVTGNLGKGIELLVKLVSGIWSSGLFVFNLISLMLITPVVCFYLLRDWDRLTAKVDSLLPRRQAPVIREQMRLIDETLAGFVRGQGLVCLSLGTLYGIGLTLAGLDFGLVIGLGAGLISFVPYVGSALGLAVSLGVAYAQFDDWYRIAIVAGIFLAGQAMEGTFLSPKLVGDRVKLHPVWIIFALLAGGALLGFVGLLLAVPVAAVIGVLSRFSVERYLQSPLYGTLAGDGDPGGAPDQRQ